MIAMRLVGDARAAAWLAGFEAKATAFDWDSGNQAKNRKHGVERAEVETLLAKPFVFEGRIIEPVHAESRWLVLGEDGRGRRLAVVFTRRGAKLRPIS
jgi:uncharacterized DUF497 family protein